MAKTARGEYLDDDDQPKSKKGRTRKTWTTSPRKKEGPPDDVEVFFDTRDRSYLYKVGRRYLNLGVSELKMHLRALGLSDNSKAGPYFNGQLEIDWPLYNAMTNRQVEYAGPLAGHRVGPFTDSNGRNIIVTDEARGVYDPPPKKFAEPEFFQAFVTELLPEGQATHLFYWLAIALRSLMAGDFRPGQVVGLAGPAQCGKSLLQAIITEIFGGRQASPMRYMMEDTAFNNDLAGAEHWAIEEPKTSTDTRTRIQFGNSMKECFNNVTFSIHAKGKQAVTLPLWRRGTISLNDDPELLMVLPPLNGSVDDKLFLFKCAVVVDSIKQFDKNGDQDRRALWAAVLAEIPAIRAWLLKSFKHVPKQWRDVRFGIKAYHNPELRTVLEGFTSEERLLNILDEGFFGGDGPHSKLEGRAMALEKQLRASPVGFEADKLLRYANQFASLLGKLMKLHPHRISKSPPRAGYTTWTIHPPAQTATTETT